MRTRIWSKPPGRLARPSPAQLQHSELTQTCYIENREARMIRYVVISVTVLATMLYAASTRWPSLDHADGSELIGHPAPTLQLKDWVNSTRLEMQDLTGKVVLLRWWTDTCDLCAATAPALRKLQAEFGDRGFTVIGIFHPKPPGDHDLERVGRAVAKYNFTFPVALDA